MTTSAILVVEGLAFVQEYLTLKAVPAVLVLATLEAVLGLLLEAESAALVALAASMAAPAFRALRVVLCNPQKRPRDVREAWSRHQRYSRRLQALGNASRKSAQPSASCPESSSHGRQKPQQRRTWLPCARKCEGFGIPIGHGKCAEQMR